MNILNSQDSEHLAIICRTLEGLDLVLKTTDFILLLPRPKFDLFDTYTSFFLLCFYTPYSSSSQ